MEKTQHLAIASVPIQEWAAVFDEEQAFRNGTLFPVLHRPFYVTASEGKSVVEEEHFDAERGMLLQIQRVGFILDDLRLYLDTHPEDKEGLKLYKDNLKTKKQLMQQFAMQYYPLTEACVEAIYEEKPDSECYCWSEGRIPWEGACS